MSGDDMITMKWNGSMVALSIFIAFIGSYATVITYEQYRLCSRDNRPKLLSPSSLLVIMSLSLGGIAIWAMHFVAMYSIKMFDPDGNEMKLYYRVDYTIVSLIVVLILAYAGLALGSTDSAFKDDKNDAIMKFMNDARNMSIEEIRRIKNVRIFIMSTLFRSLHRLILSGVITATGVCVMHYVGMEAMYFDGYIEWNQGAVAASVLIALIAATAAMWILYRLLSFFPKMEVLRFLCSVVAAIAVNGMHYCGQAAATFHYREGYASKQNVASSNLVDQETATIVAIVVSVIFLYFILIISISDLRMWHNNNVELLRELDIRAILASENVLYENERFLAEYEELRSKTRSERENQTMALNIKLKKSKSSDTSNTNLQSHGYSRSETSSYIEHTGGDDYKIYIDNPDNLIDTSTTAYINSNTNDNNTNTNTTAVPV